MNKIIALLFALIPLSGMSQGSIYLPRVNGTGTYTTIIGTNASSPALMVHSNLWMGTAGGIFWANGDANIDYFPDIHGPGVDVLAMNGKPDLAFQQGTFGTDGYLGGQIQIGSHALWGGSVEFAYASSGSVEGSVGHSIPVGFSAIYRNASADVYSKFTLVGRPGTNVVTDSWANGFLELWDVPPVWGNSPSISFGNAPTVQQGRKLGRIGADGFVFNLAGAGFNGGYYTNRGSAGTATTTWTSGTGDPEGAVNATTGSIRSRTDGGVGTSVYIKTGDGDTGWTAVSSGGSALWLVDAGEGPGATDILVPDSGLIWIGTSASHPGNFGISSTGDLNLRAGGDDVLNFSGGVGTFTAAVDMAANLFTWSGNTAPQAELLQIDAAGTITRASSVPFLNLIQTSLGTTPGIGLAVSNATLAAAGAQQVSPEVRWSGHGWKTDATAASRTVDFRAYVLPVQGAANPTAQWKLQSQVNGGGYTDRLAVTDAGVLTIGSSVWWGGVVFFNSGGTWQKFRADDGTFAVGGTIAIGPNSSTGSSAPNIGMSSAAAGILSVDTTVAGNGAGRVRATGYFEGIFVTATGLTLTTTNGVVIVTGASQTVTLPTAVGIAGRKYRVKSTDAGGLTIATTSAQTIDGGAAVNLTVGQTQEYISDGANWWTVLNP